MLRKDPFVTGEYYHIYNRGVDKRVIFKSEKDSKRFVMLLYISNSNSEKKFRLDNLINQQRKTFSEVLLIDKGESLVSVGAWCLMPNHFHIILKQEVDGGITSFMKKLGTAYSMFFNIKYKRQGALFGGPFKSKLIGVDDAYLRHLLAYLHLNPLEIQFPSWDTKLRLKNQKMKDFLKSYDYSSYQEYLGGERVEQGILNKEAFPGYFQANKSFDSFIDDYLSFLVNEIQP
ncbi:MAG: transposase [Patescibacteria group bacterium]